FLNYVGSARRSHHAVEDFSANPSAPETRNTFEVFSQRAPGERTRQCVALWLERTPKTRRCLAWHGAGRHPVRGGPLCVRLEPGAGRRPIRTHGVAKSAGAFPRVQSSQL